MPQQTEQQAPAQAAAAREQALRLAQAGGVVRPGKALLALLCLCFPLMMLQRLCHNRPASLAPEVTALLCALLAAGNVLLGCSLSAAAANTVWGAWLLTALLCYVTALRRHRS